MLNTPANQNGKIRILICTEVTAQGAFVQVTVNGVSSNVLNPDAGLKAGRNHENQDDRECEYKRK